MDTALLESDAVELLSRITGQKLSQRQLSLPVIFLTSLITMLFGIIVADSTVTDDEKQRLKTTLNRLNFPEGGGRQLAKLLLKEVQQQKVYQDVNNLLTLMALLPEAERLLLIGFGYQMAIVDRKINSYEKQYLQVVAKGLSVNPKHLAVLEAGFSHQGTIEPAILDEVRSLLSPTQFQSLDVIFVKAASDMLATLSDKSERKAAQQHSTSSYKKLEDFQKRRQQVNKLCYQLSQIIKACNEHGFLPRTLVEEIERVALKLQSQRFRLAVVGEFSQGKSTLLNALLGEEIQPVRAIPCSGTVTVLKYGARKRVVCLYKDGRQEEISIDQYQVKAAISEEAALSSDRDELSYCEIDEIIFEHPDLELCKAGVEIVDSPGLNECEDSTRITAKLLQNTDAVIFLANASRPLTQWERDKLNELRTQLNSGKTSEAASNLFVVVNFMDLLRKEKDRQDVRQRIERFLQSHNPILKGENRIHFISAQAALDAILARTEDEYLKAFYNFTQCLEKFLTTERGYLQINSSVTKLKTLAQSSLNGLLQAEQVLEGELSFSEAERQQILEQIGEVSGRDVKIYNSAQQIKQEALQQATNSWEHWRNGLRDRIDKKSKEWSSEHNPIWSQDKLIQDYINQFTRDLSSEINNWGNTQLQDIVLRQNLEKLNTIIQLELEVIQAEFESLGNQVHVHIGNQLDLKITGINDKFIGDRPFLGGLGIGGALAAALFFFTPVGWVSLIIASVAAAFIGEIGAGILGFDGIQEQIKRKVVEIGFKNFEEAKDKIAQKRDKIVSSVIDEKVESASQVIEQAISLCDNLLEQQEKALKETIEEREAEKAWSVQKRQEIEQIHNYLEAILK